MDVLEFIGKLSDLAIDVSKFNKIGYSAEYSTALNQAFYPPRTTKKSMNSDVILQLVEEYECSCIGLISPIKLNSKLSETENYFLIGWVLEDILAINKKNNEVIVLAYWDLDLVCYYCGHSSSQFLDAFLVHGIGSLGLTFEKEEDQWAYNKVKAEEASKAAGGVKYLNFWMDLHPTM